MKTWLWRLWLAVAATGLGLAAAPAHAGPIEFNYLSEDGSTYGEFAFTTSTAHGPQTGELDGGALYIEGRTFQEALRYEYSRNHDSLNIRIYANETTGLAPGEQLNLFFSGDDWGELSFPHHAFLSADLGDTRISQRGTVTAPEPLPVLLFGAGAAALGLTRRRRSAV